MFSMMIAHVTRKQLIQLLRLPDGSGFTLKKQTLTNFKQSQIFVMFQALLKTLKGKILFCPMILISQSAQHL